MFKLNPYELLPVADLISLRNDALLLSNDSVNSFKFIGIELCTVDASWHTYSGGSAYLTDKSSSLKTIQKHHRLPTTLAIYERSNDHLAELTLFRANLEANDIHVYHHYFNIDSTPDHKPHELGSFKQVEAECNAAALDKPTAADLLTLQTELERGASGEHTTDSEALISL